MSMKAAASIGVGAVVTVFVAVAWGVATCGDGGCVAGVIPGLPGTTSLPFGATSGDVDADGNADRGDALRACCRDGDGGTLRAEVAGPPADDDDLDGGKVGSLDAGAALPPLPPPMPLLIPLPLVLLPAPKPPNWEGKAGLDGGAGGGSGCPVDRVVRTFRWRLPSLPLPS